MATCMLCLQFTLNERQLGLEKFGPEKQPPTSVE